MAAKSKLTYPDDYHEIATVPSKPVIVGGQAVNLWSALYLPGADEKNYGSKDMDLLSSSEVLQELSKLPGWAFTRIPLWAFGDIRHAIMDKHTPDGKHLHVEILHKIKGLEKADFNAPVKVIFNGAAYHVLDPVVLLKAKAANVRHFPQDGPDPRNDLEHFHLLVKIIPEYLRDIHEQARIDALPAAVVEKTLGNLFKTMQNKHVAGVLNRELVAPDALVPREFSDSFSAKIRRALIHQMSFTRKCVANAKFKAGPGYQ